MPTYEVAEHLNDLDVALEAVERGELKRLIVIEPPRHGKSEKISLRFPCWYLGRHPIDYIVQAGYAESIALTHSRKARDVFVSPQMTTLFPQVHYRPERAGQETIVPERQAAHEWGTVQGGSYYAVGIGGGLTGRGFNLGIIDDPVKDEEEASSQTIRNKVWDWYTTVFRTRAEPDAAIIIVMTRWHMDDLVGRLLKQAREDPASDQWTVLHFPAIKDGKALWPERYPLEELEKIRSSIGGRAFESLYQGNPTIAEGQIIKRDWWQYYKERPEFIRIIHSWDTAFKDKQQNDYSVCTVWGETQTGYYLLDVWRGKVEFPELKRTVIALFERDKPTAVIVEDKASGQSLIQELERETKIPVLPVKVDSNKVARANAVTPTIEAGRVFIPKSAPWQFDYIEELSAFPNAEHDDQVDSTTQALSFMRGIQGKEFMVG
ncbi:MAG: phage terminase large subunit [Bacteroidales bacterium]|nr:phage terminase large subunit [Candidatus Latescibacterota bacterium]